MSHYMTKPERNRLEALYNYAHMPIAEIARNMGFCRQTIYNELKLGTYMHTIGYRDVRRYSAEKAQQLHEMRQSGKGRPEKIGRAREYAERLEELIIKQHYSPAAALAAARQEGYPMTVSVNTLYRYIDRGLFLHLRNKHLWIKGKRKPQKPGKEKRVVHGALPSIEQRPEAINKRQEPGHWEMDLIVGGEGCKEALLVLVERLTRKVLIRKIANKKAATVRSEIDELERKTPNFRKVFKSITTDNGPEFMENKLLIQSQDGTQRFTVYYCHSYAAWEKGTVECHNKLIRRFIPKGTDISKISKKRIAEIQEWINNYPRKVLGWATPNQMYYNLLIPESSAA